MKKIFFTPGPSELYPTFEKHLQRAVDLQIGSISHRSKLFHEIYQRTVDDMKKALNIPKDFYVFFTGSSLESMERVIQNLVKKNSCHLVNGAFSQKFYDIAKDLKKTPYLIKIDIEKPDIENIKIPDNAEIVCITENETSAGMAIPKNEIYNLKKKYPNKLFVIDYVSSAPHVSFDYKKIDVAFLSVQKCFGLPAGMGVLIVSPECITLSKKLESEGLNVGSFHKFSELADKADRYETPETPNVLNIFLLGKILGDMLKKDVSKIRLETEEKANLIYYYFEKHPKYKPFIKNKKYQSRTTVCINVGENADKLRNKLEKKGFVIGSGYGIYKNSHIRIANFPAHKISDVRRLLKNLG